MVGGRGTHRDRHPGILEGDASTSVFKRNCADVPPRRRQGRGTAGVLRARQAMKLFVSGVSGLLGMNLALQARDRFQISGCYYAHPVILEGVQTLKLDLISLSSLEQALLEVGADVVIHTGGLTNVEECEANPQLAYRLNVEATRNVAKVTNTLGAKLVHISTDHGFDGTAPWKTEDDVPAPLNIYARTKREAEEVVLEECRNSLIIRTNFFGWGTPARASFSEFRH